jgi:hypothetical protein
VISTDPVASLLSLSPVFASRAFDVWLEVPSNTPKMGRAGYLQACKIILAYAWDRMVKDIEMRQ